jgi:hypothetical protein
MARISATLRNSLQIKPLRGFQQWRRHIGKAIRRRLFHMVRQLQERGPLIRRPIPGTRHRMPLNARLLSQA